MLAQPCLLVVAIRSYTAVLCPSGSGVVKNLTKTLPKPRPSLPSDRLTQLRTPLAGLYLCLGWCWFGPA